MKIYLKNILCPELDKLGVNYKVDELGIEITSSVTDDQLEELDKTFQPCGLILTSENNGVVVKKLKAALKDLINHSEDEMKAILPECVQQKVTYSYEYIDNIFKFETGMSIEEYFCKKKMEWAKKLLSHYNLSLTEVSYQLGYNSIDHLIEEFKKRTGMTPARFKQIKNKPAPVLERA